MALDPRALRFVTLAITSTAPITLDFPAGQYLVTEPVVLVTVSGAPTNVTITASPTSMGDLGSVYTNVQLTFDAGAVGKRAHVMVIGQGF
jgi:hypothetical protein